MHSNRTDTTVRPSRHRRLARASASAMMAAGALLLGLSALPREAAAQQIRCWTTDSGSRECSDMPPPPTAKGINEVRGRAGRIEGQDAFAQRQASERFPVTLWSNDCGEPCTSARKLLASRGVPFTERNPSLPALQEEFKRMTKGQMQVPLLIVGTSTLVGYEEGQWNSTLDAAGYLRTPGPARRPAASPPAQPQPAPPAPTAGPGGAVLPPQSVLSPVPESPAGPGTPPVSPAGPAGSGAFPR